MSKLNFSKGSKFLSSKGFYAAIALCLVGAGAATWLAVDRTISGTLKAREEPMQNDYVLNDFPIAEETEKKADDVQKGNAKPVEKPQIQLPPPSSSVTQPSVSEPPSEPVIKLEQSQVLEKLPSLAYASPISGNIINEYSNGELVKNITLGDWRTHDGIDISAEKEADVYAVADGVVKDVKNDALWGTVITIDHHDGRQSIYCGLNSVVTVKPGDTVIGKQTLGKLDGVPCEISEESHMHFAMKENGAWIDPLSVLPR